MYVDDGYVVMDVISGLTSIVQTFPVKLYTAKNIWARFDTDCCKVSNRGQRGTRIEHVRPLWPRTDTGVTCRFEL